VKIWTDQSKMGTGLWLRIMLSVQCGQDSGDNIIERLGVPVGFRHDLKSAQGIDEIPSQRTRVVTA
jgi:hypothetical protein